MTSPEKAYDDKHDQPNFQIQIDRHHYTAHRQVMTGAELRKVPPQPIPPSRDLYEIRHDGRDDLLVEDDTKVEVRDGLRFFTAPASINPGQR
jgi:hypothetical protein